MRHGYPGAAGHDFVELGQGRVRGRHRGCPDEIIRPFAPVVCLFPHSETCSHEALTQGATVLDVPLGQRAC